MKKFSFLAMAAFGLLFAACSSDKDAVAGEGTKAVENGNQFISLSIDMPTQDVSGTRATSTDDNGAGDAYFELNDGLPTEYAVKDAYLVLFHPASSGNEDDATFVAVYDVNTEPWTDSADPHVAKNSAKIIQKVGSTVASGDLALAILNKNSLITFTAATATEPAKIKVGSTEVTTAMTYKQFREQIVENASLGAAPMTGAGFFMANAPLTDVAGSTTAAMTGAKVRTLIPITVYETEALAQAAEPAHIYVERGMAKVTLQALGSLTLNGDGATALALEGWTIDQTNKKSYLIRSTEGHDDFIKLVNQVSTKYRYGGQINITEGTPTPYKYRTYFAKDPNYDVKANTELAYAASGDYTTATGDDHPQYCFENTFDVANQTVQNTTLVRLKVKVGNGDNLFIVSGNKSTIYKESGVKTLAANAAISAIEAAVAAGTATVSGTIEESDFDITVVENPTEAGKGKITIALNSTGSAKITSGTVNVQAAVDAALADVAMYTGGISYYTIRIKHFGDQLTPWHTGNALETPAPVVGNIYPGVNGTATEKEQCAANWLGRYGVLRNNWYDIKVNSIKYLGDPTPKDFSGDPTTDDELDGYISTRIHILSWAKRTQAWDL